MIGKINKYIKYTQRFIESPRKRHIINELFIEIKAKGVITGVKSLLHIKSGNYVPDVTKEQFIGTKQLAKDYKERINIKLPNYISPKVSIIIPVYNEMDYTYNCVRSIYENNKFDNYEIIIADDNSTISSSILADYFENIVLVKNDKNLGFLKNCNNAATIAKGEYLVFLNNDTQVMDNWLEELIFVFEHYHDAGLVGSKLIYPNGALQEAGGIIWQDGSAINFGKWDNPAKSEYNYIKEADYISGASIMIKKSLWVQASGFDERYAPAYCEDSDLCFMVRKLGYKVYYQPFSEVIHFEGITHGTDIRKGIKQYQEKNKLKFIAKWKNELKLQPIREKQLFFDRDRTKNKKHILIVDHNVPTIDKDAGSRTISNFVDTLLSLDYHVKFMVPNMYPSFAYMKLLQQKGVEVLHGEDYIAWRNNWKHYLIENKYNFNAVLLSRSSICIPILKFLRHIEYPGKIIYYGHDLGFRRVEQDAITTGDISLKKLAKKLKDDEDFMYQNTDAALVISIEETEYLKKYIEKPLYMVPAYFFEVKNTEPDFEERNGILFVGGFNHPPNHTAVKWFLEEIYAPLVGQKIKFTIVGSHIPDFIYEYKNKFSLLEILPDLSVEALNEQYAKAKIAVVPLLAGAGVKGKVIEAMAKGVPVVGTDLAFEGLLKDANFIYQGCNTAIQIVDQVLRIYSDKNLWQSFSNFGKEYIKSNYNSENMKQVFKKMLN